MDADFAERKKEVAGIWRTVRDSNEPTVLDVKTAEILLELPKRFYKDIDGQEQPYLTVEEKDRLTVVRGSLTRKERLKIEKHVEETYDFLRVLPWTPEFRNVPDFAGKHHAKLDGSGYPRKMTEDGREVQLWTAAEIPIQSRMMTIADIYDALTAWNRPYKSRVLWQRALDIMTKEEAARGKIDKDLLELFIEAKVYDKTMEWVSRVGEQPVTEDP